MKYLYYLYLLLINPSQFNKVIKDQHLKKLAFIIIIIYSLISINFAINVKNIFNKYISFHIFNTNILNIIFYPIFELLLIFILSIIIYFIAKLFKTYIKLNKILFNLYILQTITILILILQQLTYNIYGFIPYFTIWEIVNIVLIIFYATINFKILFNKNILVVLFIELISLFTLFFIITISIYFFIHFQSFNKTFYNKYNNLNFKEKIATIKSQLNQSTDSQKYEKKLGNAYFQHIKQNYINLANKNETSYKSLLSNATNAYLRALKDNSNSFDVQKKLAKLYYLQNNYKKSLKHYKFIIERSKNNYNIYEYIAKIYLRLNKENKANNIIALIPNSKSLFINNTYHFQKKTKINIKKNVFKFFKFNVQWRIVDPILYDFGFGSEKSAEQFIYDTLLGYLLPELILNKNINYSNSFYNKIINQCNNSNHFKNLGIEIFSIDVEMTKKEETSK